MIEEAQREEGRPNVHVDTSYTAVMVVCEYSGVYHRQKEKPPPTLTKIMTAMASLKALDGEPSRTHSVERGSKDNLFGVVTRLHLQLTTSHRPFEWQQLEFGPRCGVEGWRSFGQGEVWNRRRRAGGCSQLARQWR